MNRIFIIGNGFDLSHGLKTKYTDVLAFIIYEAFNKAKKMKNSYYEDDLIAMYCKNKTYKIKKDYDLAYLFHNNKSFSIHPEQSFDYLYYLSDIGSPKPFQFTIKIDALYSLYTEIVANSLLENWVDIETYYYRNLFNKTIKEDVLKFNNAFKLLVQYMDKYFSKQTIEFGMKEYQDIFRMPANASSSGSLILNSSGQISKTMFLNFNYTDTVSKYINNLKLNSIEHYQIHGKAMDDTNPIVFGYGDELDDAYKNLINKDIEYSRFFKNYRYAKNRNYRNFERFANSMLFELHILGHSCGKSDSVLIRFLIEHKNCKLIRIHYYGDKMNNNFFEIHHNLSRIISFENQPLLRTRLLDEDSSTSMPQKRKK